MQNKDINTTETVNSQEENELLTEFCASEMTLGGSGQYKEAGVGRFL